MSKRIKLFTGIEIIYQLARFLRRVDAELNCIKGGGGCHLREKVLAEAAET